MRTNTGKLRFRAVIFDLDGTLIDHFTAIHLCISYALEKVGAPPRSFEEIKRAVGGSHERTLRLFVTEEQYADALRHYLEVIETPLVYEGVKLLDGARETLETLRRGGVKTAVLTNKRGDLSRKLLEYLGIRNLLDLVVGVGDTPWRKPEVALTRHVLEKLSADAASALIVGDSPFDVAVARNMGMKVCCLPTGTHSRAQLEMEKSDWLVGSLWEVIEVIEGKRESDKH